MKTLYEKNLNKTDLAYIQMEFLKVLRVKYVTRTLPRLLVLSPAVCKRFFVFMSIFLFLHPTFTHVACSV